DFALGRVGRRRGHPPRVALRSGCGSAGAPARRDVDLGTAQHPTGRDREPRTFGVAAAVRASALRRPVADGRRLMRTLDGRVAVVTGGASGIGRAMGERFAREGMKVVLADVEEPALQATVKDLEAD